MKVKILCQRCRSVFNADYFNILNLSADKKISETAVGGKCPACGEETEYNWVVKVFQVEMEEEKNV